ncbi:sensor histidine kinase [Actinoplanes sp. CA-054009]
MSLRLRLLLLVALVSVWAAGTGAWLTHRQVTGQYRQAMRADQEQADEIRRALRDYAYTHATWEGVASVVNDLANQTGQRIMLVAFPDDHMVIVDSDTLDGRAARPAGPDSYTIDGRPALRLDPSRHVPAQDTIRAITSYRRGAKLAACLTRHRWPVVSTAGQFGAPGFAPDSSFGPVPAEIQTVCDQAVQEEIGRKASGITSSVASCGQRVECLRSAFISGISEGQGAPLTASLHVGVGGGAVAVDTLPIVLGVASVVLVAILGSVLVGRRVLRPVARLTSAAERLGAGDLGERVTVTGQDEVARLARKFNLMAASLQRADRTQRRLIADVAHELRTPLTNVRGYLEALRNGTLQPTADLFDSLHEEALLQQRIVSDLQDLALADAGKLVYHHTPTDLTELVQRAARAASAEVRVEAGEPIVAVVDSDRIRQVIGNLLANAIKASPSGAVTAQVRRSGDEAEITVADEGRGIAAEDVPFVFDRFWRGDPARGRDTGGSGLGLAIVQQIVADHGGSVTVASVLGQGTTFTVRLPLSR